MSLANSGARLLLATRNVAKAKELAHLLAPTGIQVVSLAEAGITVEVEETASSFRDNAILKAVGYSRACDLPTLADDSGIEVTALGGAPGVHSARFGGDGLNDKNRNDLLMRQLGAAGSSDRSARYVCILALARRGELVMTFGGTVEGTIAEEPHGDGGFGYDPLFFYPPFGKTFGEVSAQDKDGVSHRGKAFRAFLEYAHTNLGPR